MKFVPLSEAQTEPQGEDQQGQGGGGLRFVPLAEAKPPQQQAELKAWEPSAFEEVRNVGRRGLLQAEMVKNTLAFKSGLMDAATYAEKTRELNRRMEAAAPSGDVAEGLERLQKANEAGSMAQTAKEVLRPKNWKALTSLISESVVATAEGIPAIVAGTMVGGPAGTAATAAATSFAAEYGSTIADLLEKRKISPSDTLAVRNALEDPKFLEEARERGLKRGIPIAAFDALSAGFAGRFIRTLEKAAGAKAVAKASAKEAGLQTGSGMAGEAIGQAAVGEYKPLDILVEGLAEVPGGVAEAAGNIRSARAQGANLKFTPLDEVEQKKEAPAAPPAPPAERVEPTFEGGLPPVPPTDEPTMEGAPPPVAPAPAPVEAAAPVELPAPAEERKAEVDEMKVRALATQLQEQKGYTAENAYRIALARTRREAAAPKPRGAVIDTTGQIPSQFDGWNDYALKTTLEYQMAKAPGTRNEPLIAAIQTEITNRAQNREQVPGAPGVGTPVVEPDRTSADMAGQPSAEPAASGVGVAEPAGVVPPGQAPATAPSGEAEQPAALSEDEKRIAEEDKQNAEYAARVAAAKRIAKSNFDTALDQVNDPEYGGDINAALDAYYQNTVDTLAESGETDENVIRRAITEFERLAAETKAKTEKASVPIEAGAEAKRGRGRPKLGEEEKATSEETRKQQRLASNNAANAVKKAEAQLVAARQPLDENAFDNEEALQTAQDEQRLAEQEAVRTLYALSRENRNKPGQRAAEVLKTANPRYVADAKTAYEYQKTGKISRSDQGAAAVGKPEAGFSKAINGVQALAQVIRTGNAFQKLLARRLRGFVAGVKFVVIEQGDPLPAQLEDPKNAPHWERARGLYIENPTTGERTVYVRGASFGEDQGVNNVTVLHELLHAATNVKLSQALNAIKRGYSTDSRLVAAYQDLIRTMNSAGQRFNELSRAGQLPEHISELARYGNLFEDPREFVAYGMTDPVFQEFLMGARGFEEDTSFFNRFVDAIRRFFNMGDDTTNALTDLIVVTDKVLSARLTPTMQLAEYGITPQVSAQAKPPKKRAKPKRPIDELAKTWDKVNDIYEKSRASTKFRTRGLRQRAFEKLNPQEAMEWVKSFWPLATKGQREVMARLPSMPFLADWAGDAGLPHIRIATDIMTKMLGAEKVLAENTEQLIYQLRKAFSADPALIDKLTKLVYTTTAAEVDPSDPNATERIARADADYDALGDVGQRLYQQVKEHYEDRGDLFLQLLEDNLEYMQIDENTKANLLSVLRKNYEAENRIRPYFPFVREDGDYWLSVGKGDNKEFYIYTSMRDRDADKARIQKERGLAEDELVVGDNIDSLRQQAYETSSLLRETFDAIDRTAVQAGETEESHAAYKEALKDAIYQGYLNVLPERSFRGMFKHRKGRAGYRTDLIQNIASVDGKMNKQLARLEYAQQLRNTVSAAQDAIEGRNTLQPFVNELRRRVDVFLSPAPNNGWDTMAGLAGRIGFTYMLAGLSLPLIQPIALATSGISTLWGSYKTSYAKAGASILKAFANVPAYGYFTTLPNGEKRYHWPSLVNSTTLKGDELRAMKEFGQSGLHESTLAREVWNYADKPTSYFVKEAGKEAEFYAARTLQGIDTVVGSPFHIIERWTREALFLAAYQIGRDKNNNLTHEEAFNKAMHTVKEALGDYNQSAKPRWMQRGLGKMAFALKTFSVLATQQTLGNLFRAIPILNKEGKAAAIKKFSSMMFTMGLVAGASGVPLATVFYSFAAGLVLAMQDPDDDESDEEAELRNTDRGMWFRHVWLPKHIPDVEIGGVSLYDWIDRGVINAITGLDAASRLQLATIWGPEIAKPSKTPMDAALNLAKDYFAGAYFSMVEQFMNALEAYKQGDKQKAAELASPKAIRDWMKADRYEEKGVAFNGKEILEPGNLTQLELWGQRLGFTPDIISITQKEGIKAAAVKETIRLEREALLKKLDVAATKDTPEGDAEYERLLDEDVEEFNAKYPNLELRMDEINNSVKKREKVRDDAIAGVTVTKKEADALEPLLERMTRRLEKREDEMRKGK